jgi:hypothetical protein
MAVTKCPLKCCRPCVCECGTSHTSMLAQVLAASEMPCCCMATPVQRGCKAELDGATFVGHSDLAATKDAPAISMQLCHEALMAFDRACVQMRGETCLL